jgi:hypothetical protein
LILDITAPDSLVLLKKNPITIKEGSDYAVELKFKVQGEVVTGLRYIQVCPSTFCTLRKLEMRKEGLIDFDLDFEQQVVKRSGIKGEGSVY